jgi:chromodomain-helicase-DNA-binding protein 4
MVSVEEDDLAGLEDVSSDEDDNYEAELTDGDSNSTGTTTSRRPYKKKARSMYSHLIFFKIFFLRLDGPWLSGVDCDANIPSNLLTADSTEPLPLMEGEGKAFRVLGFNQNQRAAFVQILMRLFSILSLFIELKKSVFLEISDVYLTLCYITGSGLVTLIGRSLLPA